MKEKIKTRKSGNSIKVLESQPRRRVEGDEWYLVELVAADVKPSRLGEEGDTYLQLFSEQCND